MSLWAVFALLVSARLANAIQLLDPMCDTTATALPALKDQTGRAVPMLLPDLRAAGGKGMPATLPADTLSKEGATYFWLYSNIFKLLGWAPCGLSGRQDVYPAPQGWQLVSVLPVKAVFRSAAANVPLVAVLRPATPATPAAADYSDVDGSAAVSSGLDDDPAAAAVSAATAAAQAPSADQQLIVLIRGTSFKNDTFYNDDYQQVGQVAATYGPGAIHRGYKNASDQVWPGIKAALDDTIIKAAPDSRIKHVLFSGHSLGGAVATLLAARSSLYLARECKKAGACRQLQPGQSIAVHLVGMAATNVGSPAFATSVGRRVNTRLLDFSIDRARKWMLPVDQDGRWPDGAIAPFPVYQRVAGVLLFEASSMPFHPGVWALIKEPAKGGPVNKVLIAGGFAVEEDVMYRSMSHICSYLCISSQYVSNANVRRSNWCLLHAAEGTDAAAASYCSRFPPYTLVTVFPTKQPIYPCQPGGECKFV